MNPVHLILPRLENVRQRQRGQWSARCPAHADNAPSLSIRERDDGALLLHCFAGCAVTEIAAALGVKLQDLFPASCSYKSTNRAVRNPRLLTAAQALELLSEEALLLVVAAGVLARGASLSEVEQQRLITAAGRIHYLRDETLSAARAGDHHAR